MLQLYNHLHKTFISFGFCVEPYCRSNLMLLKMIFPLMLQKDITMWKQEKNAF